MAKVRSCDRSKIERMTENVDGRPMLPTGCQVGRSAAWWTNKGEGGQQAVYFPIRRATVLREEDRYDA